MRRRLAVRSCDPYTGPLRYRQSFRGIHLSSNLNTVEFSCACGKEFRARVDQGGRLYTCPSCGRQVRVPKVAFHNPRQRHHPVQPMPPQPPLRAT